MVLKSCYNNPGWIRLPMQLTLFADTFFTVSWNNINHLIFFLVQHSIILGNLSSMQLKWIWNSRFWLRVKNLKNYRCDKIQNTNYQKQKVVKCHLLLFYLWFLIWKQALRSKPICRVLLKSFGVLNNWFQMWRCNTRFYLQILHDKLLNPNSKTQTDNEYVEKNMVQLKANFWKMEP